MLLKDWAIVAIPSNPCEAPELWRQRLSGKVYNNPRFEDGLQVTTSWIVGKRDNKVVTNSGSEYALGEVAVEYETLYPNAFNRLMNTLEEM